MPTVNIPMLWKWRRRFNTFSIYGLISPAQSVWTPDSGTTNFTVFVEGFMDIIWFISMQSDFWKFGLFWPCPWGSGGLYKCHKFYNLDFSYSKNASTKNSSNWPCGFDEVKNVLLILAFLRIWWMTDILGRQSEAEEHQVAYFLAIMLRIALQKSLKPTW